MDYGKQTSLTDALCNTILRQGATPSPAEWERIKALAERVREQREGVKYFLGYVAPGYSTCGGLDEFDRLFLERGVR